MPAPCRTLTASQHEVLRSANDRCAAPPQRGRRRPRGRVRRDRFVRDLADGRARDAATADRRFTADVAWGSPYGATEHGIDALLPIHERLHRKATGGPSSRWEIDRVLPLGEDVLVAHLARRALGPDGEVLPPSAEPAAAFSEMMLYVLVRRDGDWWLAAGQNTPIRPGGAG
jgi:uncharacterized protein (TIGR02246 family)